MLKDYFMHFRYLLKPCPAKYGRWLEGLGNYRQVSFKLSAYPKGE